jgi:mono/diheme cytochrome c family protein
MKRAAVVPHGSRARFLVRHAARLICSSPVAVASAEEGLTNPVLGQAEAISAGRDIYQRKCLVCHRAGARGPNIFATKLSDHHFVETVINGRKGTQMPAFGHRLSLEEIWQVHAFVKSTDQY